MRSTFPSLQRTLPLAVLLFAVAGCGSESNNPLGPAGDTTAPTVSSTNPINNATSVAVITASFSEGMKPTTITTTTFALIGPGSTRVAGTVAYNASTDMARFTPSSALATNTAYTATITTGAKDDAGNSLANNYVWSFTTSATTGGNGRRIIRQF